MNTKKAELVCADGSKRVYKRKNMYRYYLEYDVSPSGQYTRYNYDSEYEVRAHKTNRRGSKVFAGIAISRIQDNPYFKMLIRTTDRQTLRYNGKNNSNVSHLYDVESSIFPTRRMIHSSKSNHLEKITLPNKEELTVICYSSGNVKEVCKNNTRMASFSYVNGPIQITKVKDCYGILKEYHIENNALSRILYYDVNEQLYSEERFMWEDSILAGRGTYDAEGNPLFSVIYKRDQYQNVIEEIRYGNFTGKCKDFNKETMLVIEGAESYSKWYKYNKAHLLIEEREENGLLTEFTYFDETDLVTVKRVSENEHLLYEERFKYDEDHLLIEKVVFDGFRELKEVYIRHPETKMVMEIHNGLESRYLTYDRNHQLIEEKTDFATTTYEYDYSGKMVCRTYPLGGKDEYVYSEYGNATQIKERGKPKRIVDYDAFNRPIKNVINGKENHYLYTYRGNLVLSKDHRGVKKSFRFDEFGRCREDENFSYGFDSIGNIIQKTDKNNVSTKYRYNFYKKPIRITYDDESTVLFYYSKSGALTKKVLQDGSSIEYKYDVLGRLLWQKQGEHQQHWEYEGAVLKKYTDQRGLVTIYDYDEFGRKISEECQGRKKEFFYDKMGFCCEVREGDLSEITVHDIEGRVIEKSQNGLNKIVFEYDKEGRKTKAIKGDAVDQFFYDDENRLICHVDPYNNETKYEYGDFSKTTIDALGNRTVETFDEKDRRIQIQKQSCKNETLLSERFIYDQVGNLIQRITENFDQDVVYTYDHMNRLVKEVESGEKVKKYHYDIKGRLKQKFKQDGTCIDYEYDQYDQVVSMKSSDGSIFYEYIYNKCDLIEIKDHVLKKSLKRSYTKFGELAEEIGFSGFKTSWYYDTYGRKKQLTLVDGSSIQYSYTKNCLTEVSRYNRGKKLYQHTYSKFDRNHHVEEESLPFNLGICVTSRDLLERPTEMICPFHKIEMEFGPTSLVTKKPIRFLRQKIMNMTIFPSLKKKGI